MADIYYKKFKDTSMVTVDHTKNSESGKTYPYVQAVNDKDESIPIILTHISKFEFSIVFGLFGEAPERHSGKIIYRY